MKRPLLLLPLLIAALGGGLFLWWHSQTSALGEALLQDVAAAKARTIARAHTPPAPLHDNGFQCLGGMMDVTTGDYGPFAAKTPDALEPFISGEKPISELPPDVRARLEKLSAWVTSMRNCGDSMKLAYVDGVAPWATGDQLRWARLNDAIPALIEFTALELRVLLADNQPEVAVERCTATWELVADQSHLGLQGAMYARMAVRRLAPACGLALAAAPPDARGKVARQWGPIKQRLATGKELIDQERLGTSLIVFAWVSSEAIRAQLPHAAAPRAPGGQSRFRVERLWHAWDGAMRKLTEVADVPGPDRERAAEAVDAVFSSGWAPENLKVSAQYGKFLTSYEEAGLLLDLLAELAAGGSKPLPAGVTKTEQALEYVNAQGQKLIIPLKP